MKLATWNVNSLRVRLPQVLDWIEQHKPDAFCLQETKVIDADFPESAFRELKYNAAYCGQKTYNGVAILSPHPLENVTTLFPGMDTAQKRFLAATITGVRVVNVYAPNGERVGSDKYVYKLAWLEALRANLTRELGVHPKLALLGDFNVAPEERDVHDPKLWEGQVLFSAKERVALTRVTDTGLVDLFRKFDQPEDSFSWWDYRQAAFRRNRGLRIDHIFASPLLAQMCHECHIDKLPRGSERPSDHAPVVADMQS